MSSRAIVVIAGCAVLAGAQGVLASAHSTSKPIPPRVLTAKYYGPSVAGRPGLTWEDPEGPLAPLGDGGLGAVQFPLRSSDVSVALVPADASTQPTGGTALFYGNTNQALTGAVPFCGRGLLKVPTGAASLRVSLDPTVCPGVVTEGTVTATIAQRQPRRR